MARDLGGSGEQLDRADDWQRIESEKQDRARLARQWEANHDPGLLFEVMASKPPDRSHRENRPCPPEVAAEFGRTPEQIEASKRAEAERRAARAADAVDDWTEQFIREQADRRNPGGTERIDETADEGKDRSPEDRGTLITLEGQRLLEIRLTQTNDGPVQRYGGREALGIPAGSPVDTHIEAHAAALMRGRGTNYAELWVTREPCPGRSGCAALLPGMLAPRTVLTVRAEDGRFVETYLGAPDATPDAPERDGET